MAERPRPEKGTLVESVVNLTVHGVGPAVRPLDEGEDETWVDVERFERVLDAVAGRPDVRVTFDDGNASDVEIALPRLLERGLTAEFFVLAGLLGEPGRLDADGVRELAAAGMRIGSHGWAHRDWRRLDARQAKEEIDGANRLLGELVGGPVTRVAIPFGSYDRRVLGMLRRAGVTRAYTSDGGRAHPDSWLQARNSLRHDIDPGWASRVVDGTPPLPLRARRTVARVVKRFRG
ncbi:polysaccharide deacetylase family protein [Streptosporangium sandarakinum]|uniref:polysaccharide deacetylase family protein n=1 Tax=Streptosporangium nondiastaticum TaxID=35764 RepID=UPI0031F766C1